MGNVIREATLHRRVLLSMIMMLALSLGLATVAHAQDSFGAQYGNPTAEGEEAILSADVDDASASASDPASASASASASAGGGEVASASMGVLPLTGGPMLPLVPMGIAALALGSIGLLTLRRMSASR